MISNQLKQDALTLISEVEAQAKAAYEADIAKLNEAHAIEIAAIKADYESRMATHSSDLSQGQPSLADDTPCSGSISLTDPDPYTGRCRLIVATFSYTRFFKSTKWGTIILPVALEYADWSARFEMAEIIGVTPNADGSVTPVRRVLGAGSSTVPNRPYLIRAKAASSTQALTITKHGCTVHPADPIDLVFDHGAGSFTFKGTYARLSAADLAGKYYSSGGSFVKASSSCNPMRVYLVISK